MTALRPQTTGSDTRARRGEETLGDASETRLKTSRLTSGVANGFCDAAARTGDLIGYGRVSTAEQSLGLQLDALEAAGCVRIFSDTASGAKTDRPELARALDYLREGDVLTVWRLDRLGRSLPHLLEVVGSLEARGYGFRSLTEGIDTTTATGRLVFHIFGALSHFERSLTIERTNAGLAAARARGRVGGRPVVMTPEKCGAARQLRDAGELSVSEIAKMLGVSRASVYRALADTSSAGREATA